MTAFSLNWPKAYRPLMCEGHPVSADYREFAQDFQVTELTNRRLHDEGPHWYLYIEKTGMNTHWLARQLANHAQVPLNDVGYAGLKDRHAVTRQWFSLPLKGNKLPDLSALWAKEDCRLIRSGFYGVKLKRGNLGGNRFKITLRQVRGDQDVIDQRLNIIKANGVPNYFGEQRFGRDGENLIQATKLFETGKRPRNRQKASMYVSAARSYLFNQMLARRVESQTWDKPIVGEVFGFEGSLRGFKQECTSEEQQRWRLQKIHPTCAMWGRGEALSVDELLGLEQNIAEQHSVFRDGIEKMGIKQERRVTRLLIPDLWWRWTDQTTLVLEFSLPSGYFATSLLREIGEIRDSSQSGPQED